jgi:hypothetical protein
MLKKYWLFTEKKLRLMICDIVLKSQLFVIDEFDEFEKLDGFGDAM